jgi:hypothetical protein
MFPKPIAAAQRKFVILRCAYFDLTPRPTVPPMQLSTRVPPGVKRQEREIDYSFSSVAEVKNEWNLFLLTQYAYIASTASNLPFLILLNFGNWVKILYRILCFCNVEW